MCVWNIAIDVRLRFVISCSYFLPNESIIPRYPWNYATEYRAPDDCTAFAYLLYLRSTVSYPIDNALITSQGPFTLLVIA